MAYLIFTCKLLCIPLLDCPSGLATKNYVVISQICAKNGNTGAHFDVKFEPYGENSRAKPKMHFQIACEGLSGCDFRGSLRFLGPLSNPKVADPPLGVGLYYSIPGPSYCLIQFLTKSDV